MDTSPAYIKMCQKAEEIQEVGRDLPPQYPGNLCWLNGDLIEFNNLIAGTWLPRQDQLQEMLKNPKLDELAYFFWSWMTLDCVIEIYRFTSMEQLWLAYVMFERYQKIWNGTEWIHQKPT